MMAQYTFMMLFDDSASAMLKAMMVDRMSARYSDCCFEAWEAPNASLEDSIIPIVGVASADDGAGSWIKPVPDKFRSAVAEAFAETLREARACKAS